ncbi:hypothetical protein F8M41_016141 [Gigaspora margarita]|uniref:Uncharacterized protein n=1 Tax=Gigaspora margarita TaxID=4874 RepID=A0A8H4APW3_GIGMA|nr:hypothetical protein F8M41_016141 [Gigaspora margarita]
MNIDKIFRITKLTIEQDLKEKQEDKYSLEYEIMITLKKEVNLKITTIQTEETVQEVLERSLQTFTEWTKEMSINKTDRTFPNRYNQCQVCYLYFDKENIEELEKIYSIDEEKEIYYCKGYCYNAEILKLIYCKKCNNKNLFEKSYKIKKQICDKCTKPIQKKEKVKPLTIKEPKEKKNLISR